MLNFSDVLAAVMNEIESHNAGAAALGQEVIDAEALKAALAAQKIFTAGALSALSWEEWQGFGLPPHLAKSVARICRERAKSDEVRSRPSQFVSQRSLEDLLSDYRPDEIGSRVTAEIIKRLKAELGRNPRVVVFAAGGSVDLAKTMELLAAAKVGDPDRNHIQHAGKRARVYRFGQTPASTSDEHPLYPGTFLRTDGTDTDELDWSLVEMPVRQLLRLAVEVKELQVTHCDRERLVQIYGWACQQNAFQLLSGMYRKAAATYFDREEVGNLPVLKGRRESGRGARQSDPHSLITNS